MEDYMGLVERIKIPDERHKVVQALSAIGCVNVRDNVKNILEKLMSNELISLFNMKGNNNKLSFKSSAICGIVIDQEYCDSERWSRSLPLQPSI
ncbi:hypothetical protein MAR_017747 [Mya arenaria]|uniref:Uncharacterized protein n=1 Tax=Mya arenaria TaxID=6604 RepID=A0ABY7EHB9_MYAAR|nr:hypothetical protein MAR_017747 [Mya arenaria]